MSEQNKPDNGRRQILKGLGMGVATGAIVAGVSTVVKADEQDPLAIKKQQTSGYRETQHVRDYYDTL